MRKSFLVSGIICAALAVAFGAFGAHGLKKWVDTEAIDVFKTGVQYQFYHALALIITAILSQKIFDSKIKWAGHFFLGGIILFSGSLYSITFCKAMELSVPKWLFPLTPLGGVFFICGWLILLFSVLKSDNQQ
jgi:uncharacterized membrane protein YgdD (TMEM256/DUF423 family)